MFIYRPGYLIMKKRHYIIVTRTDVNSPGSGAAL